MQAIQSKFILLILFLMLNIGDEQVDSQGIENGVLPKPPSSRYFLPGLYENWTRMLRKNHQYRRARSDRKSSERRLMSLLDQYKSKLNTETLALMQEMDWSRVEILSEQNNNGVGVGGNSGGIQIASKLSSNPKYLTVEEYLQWLFELKATTDEFKNILMEIQNHDGHLF